MTIWPVGPGCVPALARAQGSGRVRELAKVIRTFGEHLPNRFASGRRRYGRRLPCARHPSVAKLITRSWFACKVARGLTWWTYIHRISDSAPCLLFMRSSQYKSWSPRPNRWLVESAIPSDFDFRTRTDSRVFVPKIGKAQVWSLPVSIVRTETRQGSSMNACGALHVSSSRTPKFCLDIGAAVKDGTARNRQLR
jgi:hypothetical protein